MCAVGNKAGLIPGLHPADERRRYKVTPSLIGWAQTYNRPCKTLCGMLTRLRHDNAYMRHWTGSSFVQATAGLCGTNHYLNQWTQGSKFQWNLKQNIFVQENAFGNIRKMYRILCRSKCVKTHFSSVLYLAHLATTLVASNYCQSLTQGAISRVTCEESRGINVNGK